MSHVTSLSRMSRRAEFDMMGPGVALNIQDTGGSYVDDFPAMVELSIQSADAVILGIKKFLDKAARILGILSQYPL